MLTFDSLAMLTDEELNSNLVSLENERAKVLKRGYSAKEIECDICYVSREMDLRNARRRAHEEYMRNLGASNASTENKYN